MAIREETWFDDDAGPLVRPYAVTRGRFRTAGTRLDLITLVVALTPKARPGDLEPEHGRILALSREPTSVAELSAHLDLPLGVVKVLIGDLIDRRQVMVRTAVVPDTAVLEAVLDGIRRI